MSADDRFIPSPAYLYYHRRELKIDRDYRKYDRVIAEMQAREDEMAVTFVEKVRIPRDVIECGVGNRCGVRRALFSRENRPR